MKHGNSFTYFPGGVKTALTSKEAVIKLFYALCWIWHVPEPGTGNPTDKFVVKEIVKKWK